jgi:hypothetical protein
MVAYYLYAEHSWTGSALRMQQNQRSVFRFLIRELGHRTDDVQGFAEGERPRFLRVSRFAVIWQASSLIGFEPDWNEEARFA